MSAVLQNVRVHVKKCSSLRGVSQHKATSSDVSPVIKVPARIPRGPTDILKTLSGTLTVDETGAHYKYHDDPFLIPGSNFTKRAFALSKESGRKAAMWIRQEHADLFQHKVAEPFIPAFAPRVVFNEESEVNEDTLKTLIESSSVTDAIFVYNLMEKKNIAVNDELKQSLLELVCFYNGKDPAPEDLPEERWSAQNPSTITKKTWQDGGFADTLFKSMESRTPEAYCTLIQGMVKYHQINQAKSLYDEMLSKNLPISVETFNATIRASSFLFDDFAARWNFTESILEQMKNRQLMPDIGTLNSALFVLGTITPMKECPKLAVGVISEFQKLGIKPSLASFCHLLRIFFKKDSSNPFVLNNILTFLEKEGDLTARDPEDVDFFSAAMNITAARLRDANVAHRINNILHTGNNHNFIGNGMKDSMYHRFFFYVVLENEPIQEIMKLYHKVVPQLYTPEQNVMQRIIQAVDMNGSVEYLPELWSDCVLFELNRSEEVLQDFTEALYKNHTKEAPMCEHLGNIAWAIWEDIERENPRRRKRIILTGSMVGSMLQALVNSGKLNEAYTVFQKLRMSGNDILGVPHIQTIKDFLEAVIENKDGPGAMICLNYCLENDFEDTHEMAERVAQSSILSESLQLELSKILVLSKNLKGKIEERRKKDSEIETKVTPENDESNQSN